MKTETWTIDSDRAYNNLVISNQDGDVICEVACESDEDATGTERAKLIAAAPDLFRIVQASLPALKHAIVLAEIATRSKKAADPVYYSERVKEHAEAKARYAEALEILNHLNP